MVPSSFVPVQQIEPTDRWSSKQTREGVYGEETSKNTRQGMIGTSHLTSSNSSHTSSHFNSSQTVEDRNNGSQRSTGSRHLKESIDSDLINFSQLLNEKSQVGGSDKEPNPRHMGDGSQFCNTATMATSSSQPLVGHGQPLVGVSQPRENNRQLKKALDTTVGTRSLLNGSHSESGSQEKSQDADKSLLKSDVAMALSRTHSLDDYVKEISSQSMKTGSLNHRQITDLNISSGQFNDYSDHSQPVTFKDGGNQSWLYQSMLDHHPPTIGHTSFTEAERNVSGHSISGYSQPLHNRTGQVQTMGEGEGRYLKELSNFLGQMSPLQTSTIPNLSPLFKHHIFGHKQEIRIHPDSKEQSSIGVHPGHRMADPEESFYPLQMDELSQSFSSHHGFFPLEPLQDRMSGTGKSYLTCIHL